MSIVDDYPPHNKDGFGVCVPWCWCQVRTYELHYETCKGWYGNYPPKMDLNLCDCPSKTAKLQ